MVDVTDRPRFGPYVLIKALPPTTLAARFLALHEGNHSSHVVYRFPVCHDKSEKRRFLSAVERCSRLCHPHILRIEQFSLDGGTSGWIISPYTGDVDGLLTLARLLRDKGGHMPPDEAQRAVIQLLEAAGDAHSQHQNHGPIGMDEVLIDRHGSLFIELYGMGRQLAGLNEGNSELIRDEIRSIVEIGYQLVTGLRAEEPLIPAGRLVKRLPASWDRWFEAGLDPSAGFDSAQTALRALPPHAADEPARRVPTVRTMFGRLRFARR